MHGQETFSHYLTLFVSHSMQGAATVISDAKIPSAWQWTDVGSRRKHAKQSQSRVTSAAMNSWQFITWIHNYEIWFINSGVRIGRIWHHEFKCLNSYTHIDEFTYPAAPAANQIVLIAIFFVVSDRISTWQSLSSLHCRSMTRWRPCSRLTIPLARRHCLPGHRQLFQDLESFMFDWTWWG